MIKGSIPECIPFHMHLANMAAQSIGPNVLLVSFPDTTFKKRLFLTFLKCTQMAKTGLED